MREKLFVTLFLFGISVCSQSQTFLRILSSDSIVGKDHTLVIDAVYHNDTVYSLCTQGDENNIDGNPYIIAIPMNGNKKPIQHPISSKDGARFSEIVLTKDKLFLTGFLFTEDETTTDYLSCYDKSGKINYWNLRLSKKNEGATRCLPVNDGLVALTNSDKLEMYKVNFNGQVSFHKKESDSIFVGAMDIIPMMDGSFIFTGWGVKNCVDEFFVIKKFSSNLSELMTKTVKLPKDFALRFVRDLGNNRIVAVGDINDHNSSIPFMIFYTYDGIEISRQICHPSKDMYKKNLHFFDITPNIDGNSFIITGEIEKTYGSQDYQTVLYRFANDQISNQMLFDERSQFGNAKLLSLPNNKYILITTKGSNRSNKEIIKTYVLESKK